MKKSQVGLWGIVLVLSLGACGSISQDSFSLERAGIAGVEVETVEPVQKKTVENSSAFVDWTGADSLPEWCQSWEDPEGRVFLAYSDMKGEQARSLYPLLAALYDNTYYILDAGETRYALIHYTYAAYGQEIGELKFVTQEYKEDNGESILQLNLDVEYEAIKNTGCFPNYSRLYLLVRLNQEVDGIQVVSEYDTRLEQYSGGSVGIQSKYGYLDADMEMVIPATFDGIYRLETNTEENYYYAFNDESAGIFDDRYEWVLSPELGYNYFYFVDGRFSIATKYQHPGNAVSYVIDEQGNPMGPELVGNIQSDQGVMTFDNLDHLAIYGVITNGKLLEGVVNSNLDVIIPATQEDIWAYTNGLYDVGTWVTFFSCENEKGKVAVFLPDGTQYTDYIYDSMYDSKEANHFLFDAYIDDHHLRDK